MLVYIEDPLRVLSTVLTVYNELELSLTQLFFSQGCPDRVQPYTYWFTGRKTLHILYNSRIPLLTLFRLFSLIQPLGRFSL